MEFDISYVILQLLSRLCWQIKCSYQAVLEIGRAHAQIALQWLWFAILLGDAWYEKKGFTILSLAYTNVAR